MSAVAEKNIDDGVSNPAAYLKTTGQKETVRSIRDIIGGKMYHIDYKLDYMLDKQLDDGCKSSVDLIRFIYTNLQNAKPATKSDFEFGCSTFMAKTPEGDVICGRNFDYRFASASNVFVDNRPVDGRRVRFFGIASLPFLDDKAYVAGALYDGTTDISATEAFVYCTTVFIRAILDRAASVGEALELFRSYNFFADRTGRCVVLEYMLKDNPMN